MLSFILGLVIGGTIGVVFMALFQINNGHKEHRDDI